MQTHAKVCHWVSHVSYVITYIFSFPTKWNWKCLVTQKVEVYWVYPQLCTISTDHHHKRVGENTSWPITVLEISLWYFCSPITLTCTVVRRGELQGLQVDSAICSKNVNPHLKISWSPLLYFTHCPLFTHTLRLLLTPLYLIFIPVSPLSVTTLSYHTFPIEGHVFNITVTLDWDHSKLR